MVKLRRIRSDARLVISLSRREVISVLRVLEAAIVAVVDAPACQIPIPPEALAVIAAEESL